MTNLDQVAAELRRLQLTSRSVLNTAVSMLENGATRAEVVRHLEEGVEALSPVRENAGRAS